ncbi:MAG: hypothetical protein HY536_00875 [Candidatus Colwellbacteria bacterium]|nr:hypothetical protein [Candidatus Colwellbacteria bacterium]
MALIVEEEREFPWALAASVGSVLVLVGGAVYFLFFTASPYIEKISSKKIESLDELSRITFDVSDITTNAVYGSLVSKVPPLETGVLGRRNPFAPFR